jgi:hypothetical protein
MNSNLSSLNYMLGFQQWVYKDSKIEVQTLLVLFSIENFFANIILYALSRPKLKFGGYLTFELTFWGLKRDNFAFYSMQIANFDRWFLGNFGPQLLSLCEVTAEFPFSLCHLRWNFYNSSLTNYLDFCPTYKPFFPS